MDTKVYTIRTAARKLNRSEQYIRKCIREGKIETTLVPVKEGSTVNRHEIAQKALDAFATRVSTRTSRDDGRNKYVGYFNDAEYVKAIKALNDAGLNDAAALLVRANPPKSDS